MRVSKSQLSRHQILEFLWSKWGSADLKIVGSDHSAFTIAEIANTLKLEVGLVAEQTAILYRSREVDAVKTSSNETKFFITEKGFTTVATQAILKEGKSNSPQQKNQASTLSQLLNGLTTLVAILISFASVMYLIEEK
jgi:hypothetical protein